MHMYPTIQETGTVGKVQIGQKAVRDVLQPQSHAPVSQQQQQLAQQQQAVHQQLQQQIQQQQQVMQQMRQQMIEMQDEIMAYRQPRAKTYTAAQVGILLSAETISHVLEEFELSTQKRERLSMARDYLLKLSDLGEWIPQQLPAPADQEDQPVVDEQELEGSDEGIAIDEGDDQSPDVRQYAEDELCEEPKGAVTAPGAPAQRAYQEPSPSPVSAAEVYKGKIDPEIASELEKIEQRMEELKQEPSDKLEKPKHKTGVERIKGFFTKKTPEDEQKPAPDYSHIPEGMG